MLLNDGNLSYNFMKESKIKKNANLYNLHNLYLYNVLVFCFVVIECVCGLLLF